MTEVSEVTIGTKEEEPQFSEYIACHESSPRKYQFNRVFDKEGKSLSLPPTGQKEILKVETKVGPAFYIEIEGDLTNKLITESFKKEGFPTQYPPFFIRRILPEEKTDLEKNMGYQTVTVEQVKDLASSS
jgi:hypothetical protein